MEAMAGAHGEIERNLNSLLSMSAHPAPGGNHCGNPGIYGMRRRNRGIRFI
jgi:hypothetical protein